MFIASKSWGALAAALLLASSGCLAAPAKARQGPTSKVLLLSSSVRTTATVAPSSCDSDCVIEVWMYAPNDYADPETGPVSTCAAVVQSSRIVVGKGRAGHAISWRLINKTSGDTSAYQFRDQTGINLDWGKPRYRNNARDLDRPLRSTAVTRNDTFSWRVVNSRKRDDGVCHDPNTSTSNPGSGGHKCEIAYVADVVDPSGGSCASYDPTIINKGQ